MSRLFRTLSPAGLLLVAGCGDSAPTGSLALTQVPVGARVAKAQSVMDQLYPTGSRVVLVSPPLDSGQVIILSQGLAAAGEPVLSPDATQVYFSGKATAGAPWQIYQTSGRGGSPRPVTSMPGGAVHPSVLTEGHLVFSSPAPNSGASSLPALYAQRHGATPTRLTFGTSAAIDPTVLADGRILFVSGDPVSGSCDGSPTGGLFTVNSDGTELTRFALGHDGASVVRRPRELPDGRVVVLATGEDRDQGYRPETVRKARPFSSRSPLWQFTTTRCGSVESGLDGTLLACLSIPSVSPSNAAPMAVYRVAPDAKTPAERLFADGAWDSVEALIMAARPKPMGHISAMSTEKTSGTILCLNASFTQATGPDSLQIAKAQRVHVLAADSAGQNQPLGEVALQADGSFMAEVPADTALGFETLDATGHILQRVAASVWVRPGENRTCIGCHAPYNRSPRNLRPMAVTVPPGVLTNPRVVRGSP